MIFRAGNGLRRDVNNLFDRAILDNRVLNDLFVAILRRIRHGQHDEDEQPYDGSTNGSDNGRELSTLTGFSLFFRP